MHFVFAFDKDRVRRFAGLSLWKDVGTAAMTRWVGDHIAVFVDEDPKLAALAKAEFDWIDDLIDLPLGVHIAARDKLSLAAGLTAIRGFAESTAPGITRWTTHAHAGHDYVRVSASDFGVGLAVYYVILGKALVVSFNEGVVQRAIDREVARSEGRQPEGPHWLGKSAALRLSPMVKDMAFALYRKETHRHLRRLNEENLLILNEWKRVYPGRDPLAVHQEVLGARLLCPMGGRYTWNAALGTMESSILGSPTAPKPILELPAAWARYHDADLGLTFEHGGVRVAGRLTLKK
jgi:hypothetical protein